MSTTRAILIILAGVALFVLLRQKEQTMNDEGTLPIELESWRKRQWLLGIPFTPSEVRSLAVVAQYFRSHPEPIVGLESRRLAFIRYLYQKGRLFS